MFLAATLMTSSCLSATPLTLEEVAPEQTVIAISLDNMGSMLERLKASPAGEHLEDLEDMREPLLDAMPDSFSDAWEEAMEDQSMIDMLGTMRMGIAMYPNINKETMAVTLGLTMYMGLGDAAEAMGPIWDEAMERMEEAAQENFELIEMDDHEVIRIDISEEEEGLDDDPFGGGGGGGMGMGISPEDMRPKRFYIVRAEDNILVSTSRTQMERMLDIKAGRDVDGGLGTSDAWTGINGYLEEGGFRVIVLTDHLGQMMEGLGQPFLINMMKPMIKAMVGRIDAMGMAIQAAPEPALATFQMGVWMPEGKSGLMKLMARNSPREPMPGWVAADATSYGRFNFDTEGVLPWIKEVMNSNPMLAMQAGQMMEQAEPMLQKILAGMGDTLRMSSSISYPLTAQSSSSLWAMEAKDGKEFTDALAEMAPQMGFEPRDFQGHQVYSVDMGGMMPGMGGGPGEMGIAVGGDQIFMGSLPAVEQALRAVGQRASEDSSIAKKFAAMDEYFTSDPVAMWSVSDLGSSMSAEAQIAQMQWDSELGRLEDEDPELAAELAEMMDEDASMFENLAEWIGLTGYELMSVDDGFKGRGWILAPSGD